MPSCLLKVPIAGAALTLVSSAAFAAEDQQVWTIQTVNLKLSDKWVAQEEVFERFSDNRNGLYEIEATTMLGYRLSKTVTLFGGYTHDPQYSAGHFSVMEHRLRQQLSADKFAQLGPGKLSFRWRMEERWRNGVGGTAWRVRPSLKYSIPLRSGSKTALSFSNETFLNLNTSAFQRQAGLDRMRNLISVSTPLSKRMVADIGYLNQHTFIRRGADQSDHILWASLTLNM